MSLYIVLVEMCINAWMCGSMDPLHLKDPLVLFWSEGSTLTIPLFPLLPRIVVFCHCSSTITKDRFLDIVHDIIWSLSANVLLQSI